MRFSQLFYYTLREDPGEAEIASHKLMLRAGLIRRLASGVYTFLPLGYRSLCKVERIIREEMNRAGAQEVLMPVLQPEELWQESGRLEVYVADRILFRLKDRQGRAYALGPTHEEVITDLARARVRSWRDLPFTLYQIQTKFRDEIRPRFGLMRAKEFGMKDAYSFDADLAGLEKSYAAQYDAYNRIFERCGLRFRAVEADSGAIGGSASHEFMVLADSGEDVVVACDTCGYAANLEKAEVRPVAAASAGDVPKPENVDTPNVRTIEELSAFLKVSPETVIKTLIYTADGAPVAALLRGDHQLNEIKLKNLLGAVTLAPADAVTIEKVTGAPVGFAGPVGLSGKAKIVASPEVMALTDCVVGGNAKDVHTRHVSPGRDFKPDAVSDIRQAAEGDGCPRCKGTLQFHRGIEVGHVFKLGTKYSEKMGLAYLDPEGKSIPVLMGCFGIGVGRTLAAAVEQSHDDDGIIWPAAIAPYLVDVVPINMGDAAQVDAAEKLYKELEDMGLEPVLDDRDERPGVKFKDADLIGFPFRAVVGKSIKEGKIELKRRRGGDRELVPVESAAETLRQWIQEDK